MHSETLIPNSTPTIKNDHKHDLDINTQILNDYDDQNPQSLDDFDHEYEDNEIILETEPDHGAGPDNNPPDSFWVSKNKVTDWLDNHTFIERKASVKLVPVSRNCDPAQTRSSQRSVSFNQQPQATIIGFRQKPVHHVDGKTKVNDRQDKVRLFKNRSIPGMGYVLQVPEPKSPRVSCIGRVGSKRGRVRRTGFWKSVKTAIFNRVQTNKVPKKAR